MPEPSEFDLQRAFTIFLNGSLDKRTGLWRIPPALAPNVVAWHTPNSAAGRGGRNNALEGKWFKEIGVLAGIHDYFFLRPTKFTEGTFGLLFAIEFKEPGGKGRLSPAQLELHPRLAAAGLAASCVVDNLADAKEFCRVHMLTICK